MAKTLKVAWDRALPFIPVPNGGEGKGGGIEQHPGIFHKPCQDVRPFFYLPA